MCFRSKRPTLQESTRRKLTGGGLNGLKITIVLTIFSLIVLAVLLVHILPVLPLALALELAVEEESELKMLMLGDMMLAEFSGLDPHVKRLAKAKFGRFYYSILHLAHCSDSPGVHEDCS